MVGQNKVAVAVDDKLVMDVGDERALVYEFGLEHYGSVFEDKMEFQRLGTESFVLALNERLVPIKCGGFELHH